MAPIDPIRVEQVLSNLIDNAMKYSPEGGNIRVELGSNGDLVQIAIADNGIGIPQDSVKKIFDMYMRAHEQSNGSGLGLYIVKETVERLNGNVSVQSDVRIGSCFIVEIPLQYEEMAQPQAVNE